MAVFGRVIIKDITEQEVVSIAAAFGCDRISSKYRPKNQGCYNSILDGGSCHQSVPDLDTGFCQAEFQIIVTQSNIDAGFVHQAIERSIRDSIFRKAKIKYSLTWREGEVYFYDRGESHVVDIEYFIPPGRGCSWKTDDDPNPYPDYKNVTHVVLSEENMIGGTAEEKRKEMDKEEVNAESLKAIAESLKTIIELVKKL